MQVVDVSHSVYADNVCVLQIRLRHRFLPETLDHAFAHHEGRGHDLERDLSIEGALVGEEDRCHASLAKFAEDLEVAD